MFVGIVAGLTTCALWGLTFVASRAVAPFSTWDLTVARYGLFGIASLLLMVHPRLRPTGIRPRYLMIGLLLGVIAAPGYFCSAAYAVHFAGAAVPPLIVGVAPVLLAIIANRRDRSLPWRRLAWPLGLLIVGLATVNIDVLRAAGPGHDATVWFGIALSLVALATWVGFGFINALIVQAPDAPDGLRWTGLQGIGAGLGGLMLVPLVSLDTMQTAPPSAFWLFWGCVALMGLLASWFGTWCWIVASRKLPLALLSQLIVAETVFGLIYGFVYERRWPSPGEGVGAVLQLLGVVVAIAMFTRRRRAPGVPPASVPPIAEAVVS